LVYFTRMRRERVTAAHHSDNAFEPHTGEYEPKEV
jgi:hypothetical protein